MAERSIMQATNHITACYVKLSEKVLSSAREYRERRAELESKPGIIEGILRNGAAQVREIARDTIEEVRSLVGMERARAVR